MRSRPARTHGSSAALSAVHNHIVGSKYEPLTEALRAAAARDQHSVEFGFDDIEALVGDYRAQLTFGSGGPTAASFRLRRGAAQASTSTRCTWIGAGCASWQAPAARAIAHPRAQGATRPTGRLPLSV